MFKLRHESNLKIRRGRLDKSRKGELVDFSIDRLKETEMTILAADDEIFTLEQQAVHTSTKKQGFFLHHDKSSSCPKHVLFLLLPVFHVFCSPALPCLDLVLFVIFLM